MAFGVTTLDSHTSVLPERGRGEVQLVRSLRNVEGLALTLLALFFFFNTD